MADESSKAKALAEEKALLSDLIELNTKAAKQVKLLEAAERKLSIARRTNATNTAELEKNVTKLNNGLSANAKEIQNQREAVAKAEKSLELYNKRIDALASSAEGAAGAVDKVLGTNMSSYIDRTKTLGISLSGIAGGLIDYGKKLKDVNVDLARTTGFGSALRDVFNASQKEAAQLGVGVEQLGQIMGSLSTEYSRFNALSKKQQKEMTVQAAKMEQLGVSAQLTAQTYEALSYAFGVTDSSLISATGNMDKFAMSIGTVPSKVLEDLTALAPTLARFGASGISVFKNLAREARQLGLTTQAAFDLSELFDTFESSANAAGRLNAQFGLQLNSVELMTANSDERLDILRQEFELQGKSFKGMERREKQMIADILGVDELTAGKALGSKMDTGALAKETTRKTPEFIKLDEIGNALEEAMFADQNENLMRTADATVEGASKLIGQGDKLTAIRNTLIGIAAVVTIMQTAQTVMSLKRMRSKGKGIDTPDGTGNKVKKTPEEQKGGNSKQRRTTRRAKTPDMPKTPPKVPKGPGFFSRMAGKVTGFGSKIAGKGSGILAKVGSKGLVQGLKKIPVLGALPSVGMAISRAMEGDFVGAAGEVASAAANVGNLVAPGVGTAVSLAIDGALMARDMGVIGNKGGASPKAPPGMGKLSKVVRAGQNARAQTINIGEQKTVVQIDKETILDITIPPTVKTVSDKMEPVIP